MRRLCPAHRFLYVAGQALENDIVWRQARYSQQSRDFWFHSVPAHFRDRRRCIRLDQRYPNPASM